MIIERVLKTEKGIVCYWVSEDLDKEKDTLFFMHGMTADHRMFDQQVAQFKSEYNILIWDAPAHGKSRPFDDFSLEDAADFIAKIMDDNNLPDVFLIGQSLGGYFAQAAIKKYPGKVKGFVSIGSTPFGKKYYSVFDKWILRQVKWMAHLYPFGMMKKAIAKQVSATKKAYDNMLQMLESYDKHELCHLMGLGYGTFLKENCDLIIPCPVLLLVGEKDKTGKVKDYNKIWAKETGYRLAEVPNAAHNANVDNPNEVNSQVARFLNEHNR